MSSVEECLNRTDTGESKGGVAKGAGSAMGGLLNEWR